jgi:hypothetical protein
MNGDTGAALAADQAEITAAGAGFAADAMDVSGNNIPVGGGAYVGTATTVAGATSVGGVAQGTIPVGPVASATTGLSSDPNAGQAAQGAQGGQAAQGGQGAQPAAPAGQGAQGGQVANAGNPADHTSAADHTGPADHGNPAELAMDHSMDHSLGHMPNQFELMWHHV